MKPGNEGEKKIKKKQNTHTHTHRKPKHVNAGSMIQTNKTIHHILGVHTVAFFFLPLYFFSLGNIRDDLQKKKNQRERKKNEKRKNNKYKKTKKTDNTVRSCECLFFISPPPPPHQKNMNNPTLEAKGFFF